MYTEIKTATLSIEENNALVEKGFKIVTYKPICVQTLESMYLSRTDCKAWTDETEAKEYLANNPDHFHREIFKKLTYEEQIAKRKAEEEAKARAKEEEKIHKETAKAEALGMTLSEYTEMKKRNAKIAKYKRDIKKLTEEVKRMNREIERKKAYLEEITK